MMSQTLRRHCRDPHETLTRILVWNGACALVAAILYGVTHV